MEGRRKGQGREGGRKRGREGGRGGREGGMEGGRGEREGRKEVIGGREKQRYSFTPYVLQHAVMQTKCSMPIIIHPSASRELINMHHFQSEGHRPHSP